YVTSDSIDVWLRVNMHGWAQLEKFDPETEYVGVRGAAWPDSVGDLSWATTHFLEQEAPHVNSGSQQYDAFYFYSGRVRIPTDYIGQTLEYKFVIHSAKDPYSDPKEWASDPNWTFTVTSEDTTIHWRFWNDVPPSSELPVTGNILFNVDMSAMKDLGLFDRALGDSMFIHGSFNGWGHSNYAISSLERVFGTEIYELVVPLTDKLGATQYYKYFIDFFEVDTTRFPNMQDWWGWEEPADRGAGNREIGFEGVLDQEAPLYYYGGINPDGIIPDGDTVTVTWNIYMNPALTNDPPFDPAADTLFLFLHDPTWTVLQGRTNGTQSDLIFEDPDADMVYTLTWDIVGPAPYGIVYATQYTGASVEGGGYDFGRYRARYIQPVGKNEFPRYYTFPTDTFKADPPLIVETAPFSPVVGVYRIKNVQLPDEYVLSQNYPNPFNPVTTIKYGIPGWSARKKVTLRVYNILGQLVVTLVDHLQGPGNYMVRWDGKDRFGKLVPSGVYMYRLQIGNLVMSKKMIYLK
ncbi:MAG: T9SS type A sorting domain-containing protein, partial [Fidelibacterota bacterium]